MGRISKSRLPQELQSGSVLLRLRDDVLALLAVNDLEGACRLTGNTWQTRNIGSAMTKSGYLKSRKGWTWVGGYHGCPPLVGTTLLPGIRWTPALMDVMDYAMDQVLKDQADRDTANNS